MAERLALFHPQGQRGENGLGVADAEGLEQFEPLQHGEIRGLRKGHFRINLQGWRERCLPELLPDDGIETLAQFVQTAGSDTEPCGLPVPAKAEQHVGAAREARVEVEFRNGAA